MDLTQIITTLIVALFSGSGLVAVILSNRANRKNDQYKMLTDIKESIDNQARLRDDDHKRVEELVKKVDEITDEVNDLTKQSLRVDRAMTSAMSVIIQALEDGHINGEGKEAKRILDDINNELFEYQESLITKKLK